MEKKKLIIFFCIIQLLIPLYQAVPVHNYQDKIQDNEQTTIRLSLITPFRTKVLTKTISLDLANQLREYCNKTPLDSTVRNELITKLTTEVFTGQDITANELETLLSPPSYFQKIKTSSNYDTTQSGTMFFGSIFSAGLGQTFPIVLLPRPRAFLSWSGVAITNAGSLNTNKGFIASGEQRGFALGFTGVGLTYASYGVGKAYGLIGYSFYTTVNAEQMDYFPPNQKPEISNPTPAHDEINVPTTLSELRFTINDPGNDRMTYKVTTTPSIGSDQAKNKRDGTYSIPVSNLKKSTEYTWTLTVDDGKDTTSCTYSFTTVKDEPVVLDPLPEDGTTASTSLSELSFELYDAQNDLMEYTVETSPNIGSKSGTDVRNGRIRVPIQGLQSNRWYHWYVNVTDGTYETREHFMFYTGAIGLMGYWSFDEGTGDTAIDVSGNGNNGDIRGPTRTENGAINKGLKFSGKRDTVVIDENNKLQFDDTNAFSFSVWMKWDGGTAKGSQGIIRNLYSKKGYGLYLNNDGRVTISIGNGNKNEYIKSNAIDTSWHHVVAQWDGEKLSLYIDKDLVNNTHLDDFFITKETYKYLEFGNNWGYTDDINGFHGMLDEIRIYNRSLSYYEVKQLYNQKN